LDSRSSSLIVPPFVVTRRHLYQATLARGRVRKIERLRFSELRTIFNSLPGSEQAKLLH